MTERDVYRIAETWALLADKFPTASKAEECAGEIAMARHILSTRAELSFLRGLRDDALATRGEIEALDEQHRAALAQIERWRPVVEAAETQETVHTAVRRRADNQSLNDYGAAIDATNQAVRAMRAQAKESQA